ncbi:MlaD family protein [Thalassotalea maritima]|uniref:PqiB family protein n=1 Tax=Thalassotalea maritima TaxID=3242416 RepID=UPI003528C837
MSKQQAVITSKSRLSAIWLLPSIAALIGIWLLFKSYSDAGIDIQVRVHSADGIVVNKTEVRYKGIAVGLVKKLKLEDLDTVLVTIEMDASTKPYLTENSKLWLVKPEISLSGISGLDTVLTGNYFEFMPGDGVQSVRQYDALKRPPLRSADAPGLHLTLYARELGSISHGTGVFYKQIKVGEVYGYRLSEDNDLLTINVLIDEEYQHLVAANSKFYHASGVEFSGDLSGFKVRTESFSALISGGIAFHTPRARSADEVEDFSDFRLYKDFDDAKAGVLVTMHFPPNSGIKAESTKVIFEGGDVGEVVDFAYSAAHGGLTARVLLDPRLEPYLLSTMQFWLEKPTISLQGIENIEHLLSGPYVTFRLTGKGEPRREFTVLATKPPLTFNAPGLHVNLLTDNIESVPVGATVYYRNMPVGTVQGHRLNDDKQQFTTHIHIQPKFAHLVNASSVFFEQGGVELSGTLRSFKLRTAPLESLISGGIGFQTLDFNQAKSINDGHTFVLRSSLDDALNSQYITLEAANQYPLIKGITKLKYGEKDIGIVTNVKAKDANTNLVTVGYRPHYKTLFRQGSQIWIVEPELSSANISGLNAFIEGAFLQLKPGDGALKQQFSLLSQVPDNKPSDTGLQLILHAESTYGLTRGTPITYKSMVIGQVDKVDLNEDGSNVVISLTIDEAYRHLVRQSSSFYNASGISFNANLQGVDVKTDSLDTIIRGGIALYLPSVSGENESANELAQEMQSFTLYSSFDSIGYGSNKITINFDQVVDVKANAQIQYQDHVVGKVIDVVLNKQLTKTKVTALINDKYQGLTRHGAKYWLVTPEVNIAKVKDPIAYFVGNFIKVLPGNGANTAIEFTGLLREPVVTSLTHGLNVVVNASHRGSIDRESPIYYRQIKVGEVLGVELNHFADGVRIYAHIYEEHAHLLRLQSKFYNVSGIDIDASLISGVQVSTESIDSLLAGGIAFVTPNGKTDGIDSGHQFWLHDKPQSQWLEWQPVLTKPVN